MWCRGTAFWAGCNRRYSLATAAAPQRPPGGGPLDGKGREEWKVGQCEPPHLIRQRTAAHSRPSATWLLYTPRAQPTLNGRTFAAVRKPLCTPRAQPTPSAACNPPITNQRARRARTASQKRSSILCGFVQNGATHGNEEIDWMVEASTPKLCKASVKNSKRQPSQPRTARLHPALPQQGLKGTRREGGGSMCGVAPFREFHKVPT